MELRNLRYFIVAAQEENFRRAAESLNITQSSLSRRIHDLEKELGVALFHRHQQRVHLTAAGQAFLEDATLILQQLEGAKLRTRQISNGESGMLRIALNDSVARHRVVSQSIQRFRTQHKEVLLKLDPMPAPVMMDALLGGNVDATFLYSRPPDNPMFEGLTVARDELLLALPASHALATKAHLRLADLQNEDLLWLPRDASPLVHDKLMAACRAGGLTPRIVQHLRSESVRLDLVSVGMGLTFVSSTFRGAAIENVVIRPVADLCLPLKLELAWLGENRSRLLEQFIAVVREVLAADESCLEATVF